MVKKLEKFLDMLGAIMIAVLFATIIIQVAARVVFSIPSTWTVEVGREIVEILRAASKGKGRFFFDLLHDLFVDFILVTLALGSYERTVETWAIEIPTVEWMKSGYLYLVMLIGTLLMRGFSLYNTASRIRKGL